MTYILEPNQDRVEADLKSIVETKEVGERITLKELKDQVADINAKIDWLKVEKTKLQSKIAEIKTALNI